MPKPVAFNSGSKKSVSGIKQANIEIALDNTIDYGVGYSGLTFYNSIEANNGHVIMSDSYTMGLSTFANAKPLFWVVPTKTDSDLLRIINGLPNRVGQIRFTSITDALDWTISSGNFFTVSDPLPDVNVSGLEIYLDAASIGSYPRTGTTWRDLSGNNRHATLYNGVTFDDTFYSLSFDGSNDYLSIPYYNITTESFAVEVWFTPYQNTDYLRGVLSCGDVWSGGVGGQGWSLGYNGSSTDFHFGVRGSDGSVYRSDYGSSIVWGKTYHLFLCRDTSTQTLNLYVNGVKGNVISLSNSISLTGNGTSIRHGGWGYSPIGPYGKIHSVKVYKNRNFTDAEVLSSYQTTSLIDQKGLVCYLDARHPKSYPQSGYTWTDLVSNFKFDYSYLDLTNVFYTDGFFDMSYLNDGYFGCTNTPGFNSLSAITNTNNYTIMSFINNRSNAQSWQVYFGGSTSASGLEVVNGRAQIALSANSNMWIETDTVNGNFPIHGSGGEGTNVPPYDTSTLLQTWQSIASTYDGSFLKGYHNGNYVVYRAATGTVKPFSTGLSFPRIGQIPAHGLSEFWTTINLIYNRTLTQAEIRQNHNAIINKIKNFSPTSGSISADISSGVNLSGLIIDLDAADSNSYPGSGNIWYDLSGVNNHAVKVDGSQAPTWNSGGYFYFNPTVVGRNGAFLITDSATIRYLNSITIILVFTLETKTVISGDSDWMCLFSKDNNSRSDQKPAVSINQTPNTNFRYLHIEAPSQTNSVANLFTDYNGTTWHHVVTTISSLGTNSYLNGTLVGSSLVTMTGNLNSIYLGTDSGSEMFKGKLAIVKVYNRALTSTEISNHYNTIKSRFSLP